MKLNQLKPKKVTTNNLESSIFSQDPWETDYSYMESTEEVKKRYSTQIAEYNYSEEY